MLRAGRHVMPVLVLIAEWNGRAESFSIPLRRGVLLGVLAGLAALTREVLVVCVPVLAVWVGHRLMGTLPLRRTIASAGTVVALAATMVLGWTAFQSARTSRVIAMTDKGPAVMAYGNNCSNCTRIQWWSSPLKRYPPTGELMGTSTYEDNARVLNNTAPTVAAFR